MRRAAALVLVLSLTACGAQGVVTPLPTRATSAAAVDPAPPSTADQLTARRAAGIADCPVADAGAAARPDGLPDITLECLGADSRVRLAGLRGAPMIVNVWAQWCGPCRQEAPALAALQDRLGDRVRLLGVDYVDPRPDLAVEFARQASWRYPQVVDADKALAGPLRIVGPPMTLFVAADGRVVHRHVGPLATPDQALALAHEHLGVQP